MHFAELLLRQPFGYLEHLQPQITHSDQRSVTNLGRPEGLSFQFLQR
jgi:hypothetical protein